MSAARTPIPLAELPPGAPPEPLWRTALLERGRDCFGDTNCGTAARHALRALLTKAGADVSLVTLHTWPREMQGGAYLWALGRVLGQEFPPPSYVAMAVVERP